MTRWYNQYVGLPYGRAPGQYTCWSLVAKAYREVLRIDVPEYGEVSAAYVAATGRLRSGLGTLEEMAQARRAVARAIDAGQASECWEPKEDPVPFDVVLMLNTKTSRIGHVGVMATSDLILHTENSHGSVLVPVSHLSVRGRILGYRRHVNVGRDL